MTSHKHFFYTCVYLCSLVLLNSCDNGILQTDDHINNTDYAYSAPFSRDIQINDQNSLDVQAINGSITLHSSQNLDVLKISGERRVESESVADARDHISELQVEILEGTDEIFVTTQQPDQNLGRNYKVTYNIELPLMWDVSLGQVNGNIEINDQQGDVTVELVNGNIFLNHLSGNTCANLVNGTIDALLTIPTSGLCHLNSVNGQILLSIPDTTSAQFLATVVNGSIGVSNLVMQNMHTTKKEVRGQLGAGDGTIGLHLVNGTIAVNGREF